MNKSLIAGTFSILKIVAGDEFTHKAATVAGWGKQHDEGYSSRFLHDITLEILSSEQCQMSKLGNLYSKLPDQVICAYQRNTDSCQVISCTETLHNIYCNNSYCISSGYCHANDLQASNKLFI